MAPGRKPIGAQAMTAAERQRRRRSTEEARRARRPAITWDGSVGRVYIGDEYWAAVEWSEKRQTWCIEDAEGRGLSHRDHVHCTAAAKDAAVELAFEMIRDGRMPSPERALEIRKEQLERRRQQPAAQQARQRAAAEREALNAEWEAKQRDEDEQPLYETLSEVFDFADPELWKSNSFAALRPRLIIHVEATVAQLERERLSATIRKGRGSWYKRELARITPRLAKAREILELLQKQ